MEEIKNSKYHHHFNFSILFYIKELLVYLFLIICIAISFWYLKESIVLLISVRLILLFTESKEKVKIDKVNYTFSFIFGDEDYLDNLVIYFKEKKQKEVSINIHGMKDREILVALANNYIEINKNDKI